MGIFDDDGSIEYFEDEFEQQPGGDVDIWGEGDWTDLPDEYV